VLIRDDSAERTAALNRAEVEQRFRLAFEDNTAPMFFTNLEDRVTAVNDAFCQISDAQGGSLGMIEVVHHPRTKHHEESHRRMIAARSIRFVHQALLARGRRIIVVEVSKSAAATRQGSCSTS